MVWNPYWKDAIIKLDGHESPLVGVNIFLGEPGSNRLSEASRELTNIAAAEEYEVNLAVESSYNAFNGEWSKILPYQRAQYLRAIGDQLKDKAESFMSALFNAKGESPLTQEEQNQLDKIVLPHIANLFQYTYLAFSFACS